MIDFHRYTLDNGLKVILHQDHSTPIVAVNVLYDVGARDEDPSKTGFAHLFEHLMFGGSVNIPNYDKVLQNVGGENNAFTSNDITNYYLTLPKNNVEVGLWLESDRMMSLDFSQKSLDVQRSVVIEEFKQRYLNQPYGDVWLLLRPLAFKNHPYRWPTIGKEISHIEEAKLDDVKSFFYKYYRPNNAILVISGSFEIEEMKKLVEKWFAGIPSGDENRRSLPQEERQTEKRVLEVERDVPNDALYKVYHMDKRGTSKYYATDLVSDVLSRGQSSRLTQKLIKENPLFSQLDAFITGDRDPGLFVVSGRPNEGISLKEAEESIQNEIDLLLKNGPSDYELTKNKNKIESTLVFSELGVLQKSMNLAYHELCGDANNVNRELEFYQKVSIEDTYAAAKEVLTEENSSVLYYNKKS
ncbi:MAG: insulinase family protein [Flavobacteriales bacterium]|nr:insulinase family protein [Flavobacteriales bacterium]